jgi:hypothetical protein
MDIPTARTTVIDYLTSCSAELESMQADDMDLTLWALDAIAMLSHFQRIIEEDDRMSLSRLAGLLRAVSPDDV